MGHYRFWHVAGMEWIKLRSVRSVWWTIALAVAAAAGIAVQAGSGVTSTADVTRSALSGGTLVGVLLVSVLSYGVATALLARVVVRLIRQGYAGPRTRRPRWRATSSGGSDDGNPHEAPAGAHGRGLLPDGQMHEAWYLAVTVQG